MLKSHIDKLADYNHWANSLLLDTCRSQGDEVFEKEALSSFKSIGKTFLHIWDAQVIWLARIKGYSPTEFPSSQYNQAFQHIAHFFEEQNMLFANSVKLLEEPTLYTLCRYNDTKGNAHTQTISEIILHCINHSTYHRGQIVTMLRQHGANNIPSTDIISYYHLYN